MGRDRANGDVSIGMEAELVNDTVEPDGRVADLELAADHLAILGAVA